MASLQKNVEFDVVIPVHKKDLAVLEYCIEAAKKKLVGVRNIYIISREKYTNNANWIDEASFPFSLDLVKSYVGGASGWYFQQLLKMYSPLVIPGISENVLILDSDTVFFRKVKMFDDCGRPFYNISKDTKVCRRPFDQRVAVHIEKLLPDLAVKNLPAEFQDLSGISHNMVFNREVIKELFKKIEDFDGTGDPFYKIFLKHSDNSHSASEYQIYFCFLLIYHRDAVRFRRLNYKNTADINIKKYRRRFKYHYCSFHSYLRNTHIKSWRAIAKRFFDKIIGKLFLVNEWNIGVAKCGIEEFLTIPNQKINWLPYKSWVGFCADPFGFIDKEGKKNIFFEKYTYLERRGNISHFQIDENLNVVKESLVLSKPFHLSYPYIFSDNEQRFALVESYKANKLELYKIKEDATLEKVKDLITDMSVVDPSIVKYNNIWWLFFTINNQGDSKLHLAYSQDLLGDWKMHPKNPVKDDITSSRSAGEIFLHNGFLYRPAQNCKAAYGSSIVINKITTLDIENFQEETEIEVHPNQLDKYPHGLHTIATLGKNMTLIDGKRRIFSICKPVISIARICKHLSK